MDLAILPLRVARRLWVMAVTEAAKRTANLTNDELKVGVRDGSAFCAFVLASRTRALSVSELIAEVGNVPADDQEAVFNAIADGFHVFDDARCRDLL